MEKENENLNEFTLGVMRKAFESGQVPSLAEINKGFSDADIERNLKAAEEYVPYPIPIRAKTIVDQVEVELARALDAYPRMASYHEGYAVILEELDELWAEIKMKPNYRNVDKMRREAIQVASMAIRFVLDTLPGEEKF